MHFTAEVVTQRLQFKGNVITLTLIKSHLSNCFFYSGLFSPMAYGVCPSMYWTKKGLTLD